MRTTRDLSARLHVATCEGLCGLSESRHRKGVVFMNVIHFSDRRLTVQTARNLLLLAARAEREADPQYLNIDVFDWQYRYMDSIRAYSLGLSAGIRLPRRVFDQERAECRRLAAKRGVALSSRRALYQWARP
jgi:hypothetical protein